MPVPKRRHSQSRRNKKRQEKMLKKPVKVIKTATGYKRPHVDENIKI